MSNGSGNEGEQWPPLKGEPLLITLRERLSNHCSCDCSIAQSIEMSAKSYMSNGCKFSSFFSEILQTVIAQLLKPLKKLVNPILSNEAFFLKTIAHAVRLDTYLRVFSHKLKSKVVEL